MYTHASAGVHDSLGVDKGGRTGTFAASAFTGRRVFGPLAAGEDNRGGSDEWFSRWAEGPDRAVFHGLPTPGPLASQRGGSSIKPPNVIDALPGERSHSLRSPGQHKTVVRATPLQRCRLNSHAAYQLVFRLLAVTYRRLHCILSPAEPGSAGCRPAMAFPVAAGTPRYGRRAVQQEARHVWEAA